jgi:uncharacterized protein (DUF2249 family)
MGNNEVVVDVSTMVPRERHPTVLGAWNALPDGAAMVLVNDHDPLPLYYQFAAEFRRQFRWDYLERGPQTWRVRITRGNFDHTGFVPGAPQVVARASSPRPGMEPSVLDVRPILAQGGSPCSVIDTAVAARAPGQSLVLLAPFEPRPLFGKLAAQGISHRSEPLADGTWRVEFTPGAAAPGASPESAASCCSH